MDKLSMCRICLAKGDGMRLLIDNQLREIYEALTMLPFETEDNRPVQACYVCYAKLKNCWELKKRCLQSEKLFTRMLNNNLAITLLEKILSKNSLRVTAVVHVSVGHEQQKTADCDATPVTAKLDEDALINVPEGDLVAQESLPTMECDTQDSNSDDIGDHAVDVEEALKAEATIIINKIHPKNTSFKSISGSISAKNMYTVNKNSKKNNICVSKIRNKTYKCDTCDKDFVNRSKLTKHVRIHTGEKPHQCNVCKKRFNEKCDLSKHMRKHTGEKPYQCNVCQKHFSCKSNLGIHYRIHTGEKPYQCNVCRRSFTDRSTCINHTRTHTDDKLYQCTECNKKFSIKSSLDKHFRIHTGEKPYECNVCQKCYHTKLSLNRHIKQKHTVVTSYRCNMCNKIFTAKSSLDKHSRTHTTHVIV